MKKKRNENLFTVFLIDFLKTIISRSYFIFFITKMENLFHFSNNFSSNTTLLNILELFLCLLFKISVFSIYIKQYLQKYLKKNVAISHCIIIGKLSPILYISHVNHLQFFFMLVNKMYVKWYFIYIYC